MASVIGFGDRAVARLRARIAAVEEDKEDLLAFAWGHAGATRAIHAAAVAAWEARSLPALLAVVAEEWPHLLGVDAAALALEADGCTLWVHRGQLRPIHLGFQARAPHGVTLRNVERGHGLFGPARDAIRAEALIPVSGPQVAGLLALGQHARQNFPTQHGSDILLFLGRALGTALSGWLNR